MRVARVALWLTLAWPALLCARQHAGHVHAAAQDAPASAASTVGSPSAQAMPVHDPSRRPAHHADHEAPAADAGTGDHEGHDMAAPLHGHAHRSPDYSDGVAAAAMTGMDMADDRPTGKLMFDQLEAFSDHVGHGQRWDVQGWYGGDIDKLWLRSEGERRDGHLDDGNVELLWNHAVAAFWDTQLGVRHDFGSGPTRDWLAVGVEGLAPYFLDLEATFYAGRHGRTAARLSLGYEVLFTQRLILEPEFEANLYGKADSARGIGAGLSDASLELRLRYEIRRRFAPYIGVARAQRFGGSADASRAVGQGSGEWQWMAGLRIWL